MLVTDPLSRNELLRRVLRSRGPWTQRRKSILGAMAFRVLARWQGRRLCARCIVRQNSPHAPAACVLGAPGSPERAY